MSQSFSFIFVVGPIANATHNIPDWNFSQHPEKTHPQGVHDVLPNVWTPISGCGNVSCPVYGPMYADNTAAVVCSIVIPVIAIAIALGVWAYCFYKKNDYVEL